MNLVIPANELIDTFNDLVEGERKLGIEIIEGMIQFKISGGRSQFTNAFLLDSYSVDAFIKALNEARSKIPQAT